MAPPQLMRSVFSLCRQTPVVQSRLLVVSPETRMKSFESHGWLNSEASPPAAPPPEVDVDEEVVVLVVAAVDDVDAPAPAGDADPPPHAVSERRAIPAARRERRMGRIVSRWAAA